MKVRWRILEGENDATPRPEPDWEAVSPEMLQAAIAELLPAWRWAWVEHDVRGRGLDEIAAELEVPARSIAARVLRARRMLCQLLVARLGQADLRKQLRNRVRKGVR